MTNFREIEQNIFANGRVDGPELAPLRFLPFDPTRKKRKRAPCWYLALHSDSCSVVTR
jgi:hypothetical protein